MKLSTLSRTSALVVALAASALATTANAQAPGAQTPSSAASPITTEQLLTCTVHDAWVLSGKDESKFFDMVTTLIALSEQKRGITLPDSVDAGTRLGNNIKRLAKADTDQLLYAVVDKAVMQAAHTRPTPAGARNKPAPTQQ